MFYHYKYLFDLEFLCKITLINIMMHPIIEKTKLRKS
jgi:hypothetical protein